MQRVSIVGSSLLSPSSLLHGSRPIVVVIVVVVFVVAIVIVVVAFVIVVVVVASMSTDGSMDRLSRYGELGWQELVAQWMERILMAGFMT